MSWDYYILSEAESARRSGRSTEGLRPSLGSFGALCGWLIERGAKWSENESNGLYVMIGDRGSVLVELETPRTRELSALGLARHEAEPRSEEDHWRELRRYRPSEDEPVLTVTLEGRGTGDIALLAAWARWMQAVVLDGQTSRMLTPAEWAAESAAANHPPMDRTGPAV